MQSLKAIFLLCLFLFFSDAAFAWGHHSVLNVEEAPSRLIFPVLKSKTINYCIQIDDSRFEETSVDMQIKWALRLWLEPIKAFGVHHVNLQNVVCEDSDLDLKVQIGPDSEYPFLQGHTTSLWMKKRAVALVILNSDFRDSGAATNKIVDTFSFLDGSLTDKMKMISQIALEKNHPSFLALAARFHTRPLSLYYSTAPLLLHELGHALGLCDTYNPKGINCDATYISLAPQPPSVMRDASTLWLMPDDEEGVRQLVKRIRPKI